MEKNNDREPGDKTNLQNVLIKWTGSKRRQARRIVEQFPRRIATYYEPFLGGGSVLFELLDSDIQVDRIECSDICVPLIELWQVVRDDPAGLVRRYTECWATLHKQGKDYYYEVRHEFNSFNDPYLFFFLLRTCRNGLVRFNRNGEFNVGFHGDRPGMDPKMVEALVDNWVSRLATRNVHFTVKDYRQVVTTDADLIYLDPPYKNEDGQYYSGMIDLPEFFGWLQSQRCDYLLSLNGFLGEEDRTIPVPIDLYDEHFFLNNGVGPFERLNGDPAPPISDSLYIRRLSPSCRTETPSVPPDGSSPEALTDRIVNKSLEIRAVLEAEPQLSGPEVVRRLAERGVEVDANLVRVIKHNLRKVKIEGQAKEERELRAYKKLIAEIALGSLNVTVESYRLAAVPLAGDVRVSLDDLIALATIIGGDVTSAQLNYAGRGLWLARYSQLACMSPDKAQLSIQQYLDFYSAPVKISPDGAVAMSPESISESHLKFASFGDERVEPSIHLDVGPNRGLETNLDEGLWSEEENERMGRMRNIGKR